MCVAGISKGVMRVWYDLPVSVVICYRDLPCFCCVWFGQGALQDAHHWEQRPTVERRGNYVSDIGVHTLYNQDSGCVCVCVWVGGWGGGGWSIKKKSCPPLLDTMRCEYMYNVQSCNFDTMCGCMYMCISDCINSLVSAHMHIRCLSSACIWCSSQFSYNCQCLCRVVV